MRCGDSWSGIDEHGVTLVIRPTRHEAASVVENAGTSDLPVTVRLHHPDGTVAAELTFPAEGGPDEIR